MKRKSFEELLEELNREDKEKFNYILNFYTREHVYYNFDYYKQKLKDFKVFQVEEFKKPVDEKIKKLIDKVDLKSILYMLETFKVSFYANTENKSVTDLLIYLTNFSEVGEKTKNKIIENSSKYKQILERQVITPEEILNIISKHFQNEISRAEKLDLKTIENSINFELYEKLKSKMPKDILLNDLYEKESPESSLIALSEDIVSSLKREDIASAYQKDGNVVTKDKSILVVKCILQQDFENTDDMTIERLKSMLRNFDLKRMKKDELDLFRENMQDIIQKNMSIEDIFFIKNISSNEDALLAYNSLPESLKSQVLSLNVVAKKEEISKVLDALSFIKSEKQKQESDLEQTKLNEQTTFGIELELNGFSPETLSKLVEDKKIYKTFEEKYELKHGLYRWKIDYDGTVPEGLELISPVMTDCPRDWESLEDVSKIATALNLEAGNNCGGHIHIGSNILGTDEKAWKNLFRIWQYAEPIIYKMSNEKGEDFRETIATEATPVANIIEDMFKKDIVKIKNDQDVINLATEYTRRYTKGIQNSGRTKSMNLQCIAEGKQNTIEFRIPNSSLNSKELKSNIKFFARIVELSKQLAVDKDYKKEIFEKFLNSNDEKDRMYAFVNLLLDNENDKQIFYERYFSRPEELVIGERKYSEIVNKEVGVNENERYEWRNHR